MVRQEMMAMAETLYPWGYRKALVTMARMKQLARWDLLEYEVGQRVEAYLKSKGGTMGIGGAVRFVQPEKDGFAPPGKSFHELQTFVSGQKKYCAFDLVMRNGANNHRAPRWSEVPKQGSGHVDIKNYGVHANVDGEPWHLQPIEIDGWQTWINNGRPHPNGNFPIKGVVNTPTTVPALASRVLRLTAPVMRGGDVTWVQNFLRSEGMIISADGYYGRITRDKVKSWQARNGHTADGIVGPKTWAGMLK
jgi:peptidoglycan hydrolase-like protein with peptidoglycan-binding domain